MIGQPRLHRWRRLPPSFCIMRQCTVRPDVIVDREVQPKRRLMATPTLAVPPFSTKLPLGPEQVRGENVDPQVGWTFTWPFNVTGQPAVSIPCGLTKDGLPLGLQLVGRRGADALILRVAAAIEAQAPWSDWRPRECPKSGKKQGAFKMTRRAACRSGPLILSV